MSNMSSRSIIKIGMNNKIHKLLNPNKCKQSEKFRKENRADMLSDKEKIALFDKIALLDMQVSNHLYWLKLNNKEKNRVIAQRNAKIDAGIKRIKVKRTKAEWEALKIAC